MKKHILTLFTVLLIASSCKKQQDPFLIEKQNVGLLTDSTQVKDLKLVFPNDSIVKKVKGDEFIEVQNDIQIFSKDGNELLTLTPSEALDSTATISTVQILSPKYRTAKDISKLSTFKDIADNYKISKISNLINSIVISVNELNASFTIDKKELPSSLRYDMNITIEKSQIPDEAKIKYFFIHWN